MLVRDRRRAVAGADTDSKAVNPHHQVHIIPDGKRFAVRVGMFTSIFGYNSAIAAKLPGWEALHDECKPESPEAFKRGAEMFKGLTKKQAEVVAAHMSKWIESLNLDGRPERGENRLAGVKAKYKEAMNR